jgi:hypothetical protein
MATPYHINLKLYSPAYQAGLGCTPFNRRESFGSCQAQVHSSSFSLPFCHSNPVISEETPILQQDQATAAMLEHAVEERPPVSRATFSHNGDDVASSLVILESA